MLYVSPCIGHTRTTSHHRLFFLGLGSSSWGTRIEISRTGFRGGRRDFVGPRVLDPKPSDGVRHPPGEIPLPPFVPLMHTVQGGER